MDKKLISNLEIKDAFYSLKGKMLPIALAVALSTSLMGCSSSEKEEVVINEEITEVVPEENETSENKDIVDIYEQSTEADTRVESYITGVIELGEKVANAGSEYKQTEDYQNDVENLKTEFDALVNFILGKTEIDGYTINDIGSNTLALAKDAIETLDGIIESYIPDYKDKAKEKLKELGDLAWDKSTDLGAFLSNKYSEWKEEVQNKR